MKRQVKEQDAAILSGRLVLLEDGSRYDMDQLECDDLLSDLKDWDYPIFDLLDRYGRSVLSAVTFLSFAKLSCRVRALHVYPMFTCMFVLCSADRELLVHTFCARERLT